jgi:PilZ domain
MQSKFLVNVPPAGLPFHSGERRNNPRFDLHFPALLRVLGDSWAVGETADVSATGAFFVTDRPFLLSAPIEYVLTFPPDLTKVANPLRVRFFGKVLRSERVPDSNGAFRIAVRSDAHRYLSREQSASFDAIEQKLSATSQLSDYDSAS